ncbi:DNA polymerase beta superfamily protein [Kribbella pittospori]|uniref:DNA polymerase beta superfamily protein n=1 Tax=Kribbella pittospori TaxID=722689 RepID=UPI00192E092D
MWLASTPGSVRSAGGVSVTRDLRQLDYAELRSIMGEQPYHLLFATVSGAHLYGFPSRDS